MKLDHESKKKLDHESKKWCELIKLHFTVMLLTEKVED